MAIGVKTRKMLWARSGNRCAICRIELVEFVESMSKNSVIGEECHIISANKGPRHKSPNKGDLDSYDNLILLCPTDHTRVDSQVDIYTVDKLNLLKKVHENWVKTTLERDTMAFMNDQENVKSVPELKTGKEILNIVANADAFDFSHDEVSSSEEAELIGYFLDGLKEFGEFADDLGYTEFAKECIKINSEIEKLKLAGYSVFGMERKFKMTNNSNSLIVSTATIVIVKSDNPAIYDSFLIAKFPNKMRF